MNKTPFILAVVCRSHKTYVKRHPQLSENLICRKKTGPSGRKENGGFEWNALKALAPYLWSRGGKEAKLRVVAALILLAAAKVATVYIPIVYGDIIDAFETGKMKSSFCLSHSY